MEDLKSLVVKGLAKEEVFSLSQSNTEVTIKALTICGTI